MSQSQKIFTMLFLCIMATWISCADAQLFPFPIPSNQGGCWSSILETEGCVQEILTSFLSIRIGLGPKCCKALDDIGDNCFQSVFSSFPFAPSFPSLLKSFCAGGTVPTPGNVAPSPKQ